MGEPDNLPFPYEFEKITPEEQEYVDKVYGNGYLPRSVRIGPKGYILFEPYHIDAANIYNMPLRPTDIFVSSYQRSGKIFPVNSPATTVEFVCRLTEAEKHIEDLNSKFALLESNNIEVMGIRLKTSENLFDLIEKLRDKIGTTWTQELVWLLANNLDYKKAAEVPLIHRYPFLDQYMFIDVNNLDKHLKGIDSNLNKKELIEMFTMLAQPVSGTIAKMPETEPRFIKTHLPMSLLNPKLLDTAKMVYVARDPRDVAVSCYHHFRLFKVADFQGNFKEFWKMFYKDLYFFCPIFEHVKEAWNLRHHPNMLFLFYEELSKDLPVSIRRVADFLGKNLNTEEMDRLCDHLSFKNFKNNKSVNYEEMREQGLLADDETFVRKGKAGGWRDYFDEEMTLQAEQWITENLRDSDLRFPHIDT